jgi:hypothetical protein
MSDVIDDIELVTSEIERCDQCGLVVEDLEALIELRAADLVTQWELADPRDGWRHTGDPAPPANVQNSDISPKPPSAPRSYRPAQSTIDAFFYIVRTKDADGIFEWLARHPLDAPHLHKLWKKKC